jgi:hypothetical protein
LWSSIVGLRRSIVGLRRSIVLLWSSKVLLRGIVGLRSSISRLILNEERNGNVNLPHCMDVMQTKKCKLKHFATRKNIRSRPHETSRRKSSSFRVFWFASTFPVEVSLSGISLPQVDDDMTYNLVWGNKNRITPYK